MFKESVVQHVDGPGFSPQYYKNKGDPSMGFLCVTN